MIVWMLIPLCTLGCTVDSKLTEGIRVYTSHVSCEYDADSYNKNLGDSPTNPIHKQCVAASVDKETWRHRLSRIAHAEAHRCDDPVEKLARYECKP